MKNFRTLLFIATILIIATSTFLYVFLDNNFLMRKWNLPLDPPGFRDSRQFAWASEAHSQGYDSLIENPANPTGQQLNYPRIWHLLFALGINEGHANIMGSIVIILFFIGIGTFWFSRKFDNLTYIVISIVLLSPSSMLGVERSNIELIIFFIISLALLVCNYSNISALFLLLFASILKIYPVFSFIFLLKENRRKFWTLFLSVLGIFIFYAVLSLNDLIQVYHTTPKLAGSSFGMNVWWRGLNHSRFLDLHLPDNVIHVLRVLSYVMVILIFAGTLFHSLRIKDVSRFSQGAYLDAFRAGAGIYIGCYIVINNMDYRLIFLIFTIPQLVSWLYATGKSFSLVPLFTLSAMFFSLWSTFTMRFLGRKVTFILEEISNWLILTGLLYLLLASLPDWLRNFPRQPFSITGSINKTTTI
jgi:hypothetical protein